MKIRSMFNKPIFAYLTLVGGFLVQLTLGAVYTYGNMAPYMLSYMENNTKPYNKIDSGNAMWIFGLSVFGLGATMSLGGFLVPIIGATSTILIGSWLMSLGVITTYWTIKTCIGFVALTYGLVLGLGVGIAYGTVINIPSQWFPESKGFTTGIVVAGFGFAPITLDFIQSYYINPNSSEIHIKNTDNVPFSFVLMGSIYAIIQLIGSVLIRTPNSTPRLESAEANIRFRKIGILDSAEIQMKPIKLMFQKDFWVLWLSYTFNSCVAILVLSLHKVFGETLSIIDINLTIASAIGAGFNGIGRIAWGFLIDKFSYKTIMTILTLSMSLMIGTFYLCSLIPNVHQKFIMFLIWVIILHFLLSGNFSIYPVICSRTFGQENSVVNYGVLFTAYALAGLITSSCTTVIFKMTKNHNKLNENTKSNIYLIPFLVGSALSLLSAIVTRMYRGRNILRSRPE